MCSKLEQNRRGCGKNWFFGDLSWNNRSDSENYGILLDESMYLLLYMQVPCLHYDLTISITKFFFFLLRKVDKQYT